MIDPKVLKQPFAVVYLDGRNEHGSHVLPGLPVNIPPEYEESLPDYAEEIISQAEKLGFAVGDIVWTIWRYNQPQYGDYGRIEIPGYWEFETIDPSMSVIINDI